MSRGSSLVPYSAAQQQTGHGSVRSLSLSTYFPLVLINLNSWNHLKILPDNSLFPSSIPRVSKQLYFGNEIWKYKTECLLILLKIALI